jgi:hypothetical protein
MGPKRGVEAEAQACRLRYRDTFYDISLAHEVHVLYTSLELSQVTWEDIHCYLPRFSPTRNRRERARTILKWFEELTGHASKHLEGCQSYASSKVVNLGATLKSTIFGNSWFFPLLTLYRVWSRCSANHAAYDRCASSDSTNDGSDFV